MNVIENQIKIMKKDLLFAGLTKNEYFKIKDEFHKENRRIILLLSTILCVVFFLAGIVTKNLGYRGGEVSLFFFMAALQFAFIFISHWPAKEHINIVEPVRSIFSISLYAMGVLFGLVFYPDQECVMIIVFIAIVPLIFYERPIISFTEGILVAFLYALGSWAVKSPEVFSKEIVDIISYLIASLLLNSILMKIKAENKSLLNQVQNKQNILQNQIDVIEGIGSEYDSIWLVNGDNFNMSLISNIGNTVIPGTIERVLELKNYLAVRDWYFDTFLEDKDKERIFNDTEPKAIFEALSQDITYTVSYKRVNPDGSKNYHQVIFAQAGEESEERRNFVLGLRSIDQIVKEEKEQRQALEEALVAAEQANVAKTTFLSNMSHDIRTPMNAILGFTDLMEKYDNDSEKRKNYRENIKTSSNYLLGLINEVLEMARIENGNVELDEEPVDLSKIIEELKMVFDESYSEKKLNIERDIKIDYPYAYCDRTKMEEIYLNIVSNAVKYTSEGGTIRFYGRDFDCGRANFRGYEIVVEDNGIGMSKKFLPHIFDSFSREKTVTENKIVGSGLGMGIVKKLVDLMEGTIDIESELGKGTKVTLKCQLRTAEASDLEVNEDAEVDFTEFEGKKILLAEDNELNAEIACEILTSVGFSVDRVEDGVQCVAKIQQSEPGDYDVILMDIQMPNMDGIKATVAIRRIENEAKAKIPIIAMTANVFDEDKQKCFDAGMDGFTKKPIDLSELFTELERVF